APVLDAGAKPLIVGGDHAISYPVLRAVTKKHGPLTIVHFDAHADLYDEFDGRRFSHACPFARVMEHCPQHRLIQIGVRSVNRHLLDQALKFGVQSIPAHEFSVDRVPSDIEGPVYVSVDIDALDPAFAPGVSHHEPGGLTTRDILSVVQNLRGEVIGADIVEFNPRRDVNDMTAMVTAKLVRELGHKLLP
ncbi:MAG: agmatinase, partial [Pseudomonadota bacterium]